MGRHSCCYKQKLRKGLWSPEEDEKLLKHITKHGHGCWSSVPKLAGLQRCGKSCRLRWINYLRPDLKRGTFSQQEENVIIELHAALGNRWSQIASQLPGRTDNEIKNYWNSCIKKKLKQKGIDPNTHKPLDDADDVNAHDNEGGGETSNSDRTSSKSTEQKLPTVQELAAPSVQSAQLDESPVENAGSMPPMSMKELFLDRYVGHGSCSGRPLDMAAMGCDFPLGQSSFGGKCDEDPTASLSHQSLLLWFNQSAKLLHTNSEFGCSDMLPPSIPSATSSILSAAVKTKPISCFQPDTSLPGDSGNNNVISANNGNGIELHGSGALFDGGVFPWPELLPNKGSPTHLDGVPEDLKWCEYLNGGSPFAASAGQHSQGLYGATKEENQFSVSGLSSWHESKLQSPAGMYSKDFEQRIPPVFEQRIPPVFEQF